MILTCRGLARRNSHLAASSFSRSHRFHSHSQDHNRRNNTHKQTTAMSAASKSFQNLKDAVHHGRGDMLGTPPAIRSSTTSMSLPPCLAQHPEDFDIEEFEYQSEHPTFSQCSPSQAWVPTRIVKPKLISTSMSCLRCPVVIFIHCTGSNKDSQAHRQAHYARRGYYTVAIDTRYHGSRVDPNLSYQQSLVKAYFDGKERPFLLDVVWDLQRLVDHLTINVGESEIDPKRIAVTGESLGGMVSWLFAAVDGRIAVTAPIAGVQYFRYAVENNLYHDRVGSIPEVYAAAAKHLGKPRVDEDVVVAVARRIMPGLFAQPSNEGYDAPQSLSLISPRPCLIVTGEIDGKTPLQGIKLALEVAQEAYRKDNAEGRMRLYVDKGVGHEFTSRMLEEVDAFIDEYL